VRDLDKIIEGLHPKQQAGLSIEGEDIAPSPDMPDPSQAIAHMKGEDERRPRVRFVAEPDPSEIWSLGDDRLVGGVDITYTPDTIREMQSGYKCIRCMEPQDEAFPLNCSLCGYEMRDSQIRDMSLEFKGEKHLGPSRPITEYLDELDARHEKAKFAKKIAEGGYIKRRRK
jgi:hypothetical protein